MLRQIRRLPPYLATLIGKERNACHVCCPSCSLVLGLRLLEIGNVIMAGDSGSDPFLKNSLIVCRKYVRRVDADGDEAPEEAQLVPPGDNDVLRCTGVRRVTGKGPCGQAMFRRRDVLSEEHCWVAQDTNCLERSYYINHLVPGSFQVGPPRKERLMQGTMEVADVSCSACEGIIGWKFVKDCSAMLVNVAQAGRFGILASSFNPDRQQCQMYRNHDIA
eukprot:jgi/Botrbrau1/20097/Bobra.0173s0001.1